MSNQLTECQLDIYYKTTRSRQAIISAVSSRQTSSHKTLKINGFLLQRILETPTNTRQYVAKEFQTLQDLETLDPATDTESSAKLLKHFDWKDSTLAPDETVKIEELSVKLHKKFARH